MTVILDQFIHTLVESELMTAEEIGAFVDGFSPENRPTDGEALAKLLFQRKKLTRFQIQCIYQGKTKGLIVGNYVVLDKIGQGGMGHVYKARHKRMKRVVALKVLPSAMTKTPEAVQRFEREVEVAARLEHPNIVTAHDADEAGGVHFLVMQYVQGSDLAELVRKKGTLTVAKALDYLIQAGRGLDYSHAQGVIHRDIKPSNLLLDDKGTVKILDMGLARLEQETGPLDSTDAASLTQSGQVMGTVDYMPPEQSMDTHHADNRADIYSLGCTLYYLLTGRAVFGGDTLAKKIMAHREKTVPSLRALRPDVSEGLNAVFQKMLAKRPEDRHAKMSAVLADLEACRVAIEDGVEETITYQGEASEIDTSGTRHDATVDKPDDDSALDRWLKEELPAGPTHFISQPRKNRQLTKQQIVITSAVAVICFLTLCLGVVFSIKTPEGTLVVTVDEPDAEISVDGGKITLRSPGDDEPVTVEVVEGEHTLSVSKGGFRTYTNTFTIKSRGREVFHVEMLPLVTAAAQSEIPEAAPPEVPPASPLAEPDPAAWKSLLAADAPPPAVAPFDSATAKKHQEAWAEYLGQPVEEEIDLGGDMKLTMTLIPPGEFVMGSSADERTRLLEEAKAANDRWAIEQIPTEGPRHRVRITKPFRLGRHEVTVGQFRQFVDQTGYKTDAERDGRGGRGRVDGEWVYDPRFVWNTDPGYGQTDDHPVVNVSWNDAVAFCEWLSEKEEAEFVLPSEAQWEYACRAGTTTFWHCGDDKAMLQEYAWFNANSGGKAHPVGQLKPNGWGLYDMHGNVWERCADRWSPDYYAQSPMNDPNGPTTGSRRVYRGGGWHNHARRCRSANRLHHSPDNPNYNLGFRLASVNVELLPLVAATAKSGKPEAAAPELPAVSIQDAPLPEPDPDAWKAILAADAPLPAIAPFDAEEAKKHQHAWAEHLGVPVEQEVTLADGVKLTMTLIPPGEFVMGSPVEEHTRFLEDAKAANETWVIKRIPTEGPRHRVRITKPFRLGRHEVTVGQFRQFVDQTGYKTDAERDGRGGRAVVDGKWVQDSRFVWNTDPGYGQTDDHPVVNVSWNDAVAFCEWLSEKEEAEFVLPSEAQWEYACRAGTTTFWHCGDDEAMLREYAWFRANSGNKAHPVGELLPNGFCLYDMPGNVWEWCADYWATDYYAESPSNDPSGPSAGSRRVIRGGCWHDHARYCRSAHRHFISPGHRDRYLGFRLASVLADDVTSAKGKPTADIGPGGAEP